MNEQEQNVAIAELCGEKMKVPVREHRYGPGVQKITHYRKRQPEECKSYTRDLNAAFAAVRYCRDKVMSDEQWENFGYRIYFKPWLTKRTSIAESIFNLTPAVICEQLLRAVGKWRAQEGGA